MESLKDTDHYSHCMSDFDTLMMFLKRGNSVEAMRSKHFINLGSAKSGSGEGPSVEDTLERRNRMKVEVQSFSE